MNKPETTPKKDQEESTGCEICKKLPKDEKCPKGHKIKKEHLKNNFPKHVWPTDQEKHKGPKV